MKFLYAILSSIFFSFLMFYFVFDMELGESYINLFDATFVVGIFYFFIGLLTLSNAGQVFRSTGYVLKNMFWPSKIKYRTYYEYLENNPRTREKTTGLATMMVGFIYVLLNVILASQIF